VDLYLPLVSFVKFVSFRYQLLLQFGLLVVIIFSPIHLAAVASNDITFKQDGYSEELRLESEVVFFGLEFPTAMAFLGSEDILVLEQGKGTVQRILHGQIMDEPVLDVNVVNERDKYGWNEERGLLGIAVTDDAGASSTPRYVFLYYTEAEGEDGGDPIGNRLYRYELIDNKLVNPKLLLDLPVDKNNPAHNGGAVAIGPDENIYIIIGNLVGPGLSDDVEESLDQNIQDGKEPDGRGGILRVTQDGEVVDNEGVLGDNHPLDKYYAYGIRNSFGIAFDPFTGNLWDTENGGFFDEINLVSAGFNSGWNKLSGKSEFKEGFDAENDLIDFDGKGKYSDPEFSWQGGTVPTAIMFFHSNRLGTEFENDLFVGTATGNLYHFDLTKDRTQLDLKGELDDKVADNFEESESALVASNLGIITDLELGPDGYLYGTSYQENGSIFKINSDQVLPLGSHNTK
jgi:aldose sugar dehydrogenase